MSTYHKIPENSSLDLLKWSTCFGGFLLENFWEYGSMVVLFGNVCSWNLCCIHEIGQGFISSLFWIEMGKECNLSQMEHFLFSIEISRLKCFSAVKENAHNLATTWFRWLTKLLKCHGNAWVFLVADKSLKKLFFSFSLQVVKGLRYLWELKIMHRGKDMN